MRPWNETAQEIGKYAIPIGHLQRKIERTGEPPFFELASTRSSSPECNAGGENENLIVQLGIGYLARRQHIGSRCMQTNW